MTKLHYRNVPTDADGWATEDGMREVADVILDAIVNRHPVTVGYLERRKELREVKKRDGSTALEWKPVEGQWVHIVRTMEFFNIEPTSENHTVLQAMDRCPSLRGDPERFGPPEIRSIRLERITDYTVHVKSTYRLKNRYFIERVREHAEANRLHKVTALTDDALWEIIQRASDRQEAEILASKYAAR